MTTKTKGKNKAQKAIDDLMGIVDRDDAIEESAHKSGEIRAESLSRAQSEMQKFATTLFDRIGFDQLVNGKMQIVINTESESRIRMNCKGYFRKDAFKDKDGVLLGVINIVPEMFDPEYDDKPKKERIAATLIHEMVHATNSCNGLVDCTKRAHNLKFKTTAELVNLVVTKGQKAIGYGHTELSDELRRILETIELDETAFEIFALDTKDKPIARDAAIKWICSNDQCGLGLDDEGKAMSGKPQQFRTSSMRKFNILCMDCSDSSNEWFYLKPELGWDWFEKEQIRRKK